MVLACLRCERVGRTSVPHEMMAERERKRGGDRRRGQCMHTIDLQTDVLQIWLMM